MMDEVEFHDTIPGDQPFQILEGSKLIIPIPFTILKHWNEGHSNCVIDIRLLQEKRFYAHVIIVDQTTDRFEVLYIIEKGRSCCTVLRLSALERVLLKMNNCGGVSEVPSVTNTYYLLDDRFAGAYRSKIEENFDQIDWPRGVTKSALFTTSPLSPRHQVSGADLDKPRRLSMTADTDRQVGGAAVESEKPRRESRWSKHSPSSTASLTLDRTGPKRHVNIILVGERQKQYEDTIIDMFKPYLESLNLEMTFGGYCESLTTDALKSEMKNEFDRSDVNLIASFHPTPRLPLRGVLQGLQELLEHPRAIYVLMQKSYEKQYFQKPDFFDKVRICKLAITDDVTGLKEKTLFNLFGQILEIVKKIDEAEAQS